MYVFYVKHYDKISRRVDDLRKKGYIDASGKRAITVGKRVEDRWISWIQNALKD